jgi:hypothetical protein
MIKKDAKQFLYVMQCKDFIKIGVSKHPEQRIRDLQIGNPFRITLLLKVKYDNSFQIEQTLHKYFNNKNETGEWFSIDETVKNLVKYLKNIEYNTSR